MLDNYRILSIFSLFTDLEEQQALAWQRLCENAAAALCCRIKAGVDVSAHMERLCTAAAAMAYGDYLMLNGASASGGEVRVGDISVKNGSGNGSGGDATEIRAYFLEQVADLLETRAFAFVQTEAGQ